MTMHEDSLGLAAAQWDTIWTAIHVAIHGTVPAEGWRNGLAPGEQPVEIEDGQGFTELEVSTPDASEALPGASVHIGEVDRESVYRFDQLADALGLEVVATFSTSTDSGAAETRLLASGDTVSIACDGDTPDYCDDECDAHVRLTIVFGDRAARAAFDAGATKGMNEMLLSPLYQQSRAISRHQRNDLLDQLDVLVGKLRLEAAAAVTGMPI